MATNTDHKLGVELKRNSRNTCGAWLPPGEMSCIIKCMFVWHTSHCYQPRTALHKSFLMLISSYTLHTRLRTPPVLIFHPAHILHFYISYLYHYSCSPPQSLVSFPSEVFPNLSTMHVHPSRLSPCCSSNACIFTPQLFTHTGSEI